MNVLRVVDVHVCDYVKGCAALNSPNIITFVVQAFQMHLFDEKRLNLRKKQITEGLLLPSGDLWQWSRTLPGLLSCQAHTCFSLDPRPSYQFPW